MWESACGIAPPYTQTVCPATKYPREEPLCPYCGKIRAKKHRK